MPMSMEEDPNVATYTNCDWDILSGVTATLTLRIVTS